MADSTRDGRAETPFLPHGIDLGATRTAGEGAGTGEGTSTPEIRVPAKGFTCRGCPARWTGLRVAHCSACHRSFTTAGNFDRHRGTDGCRAPHTVGLVQRPDGLWSMPAADPTQQDLSWRNR